MKAHQRFGQGSIQLVTPEYARALARVVYEWAWPLVNMHNRRAAFVDIPTAGLIGGVVPAAPLGQVALLHDYVAPEERFVACPNQDVVYGFGLLDAERGPSIVQVPDFGGRFWVYQAVDQRTDAFAQLGSMYDSEPGFYLLAPTGWDGKEPAGIKGTFRFDTRVAALAPRVFMDDTAADRAAIQPLINQIAAYPLAEYTGEMRITDWSKLPTFPPSPGSDGDQEVRWVDPATFFPSLAATLDEVPARPGEEALYSWARSLLAAADADPAIAAVLAEEAPRAEAELITPLFQFRNIGIPAANKWTTQRTGAQFGTDYLSRTAMAKANIFVNTPNETCYYYQDLDAEGARLDGSRAYQVRFRAGELPDVKGFWSLTLYNEHHFFAPNDLKRYSLGTKNKDLRVAEDGSLTLYVQSRPPEDPQRQANWLPAPASGPFSLYLRAYWPGQSVIDGIWTPPAVTSA